MKNYEEMSITELKEELERKVLIRMNEILDDKEKNKTHLSLEDRVSRNKVNQSFLGTGKKPYYVNNTNWF